ncbi:adenosine deaminase domain-containing protein 1 isoform X2 [Nelusetta ayraudi]|uniref:adenosine deaminase domain-containing protein 1 isoform X2 n=1 Tax=Nelusetta ayraudi TaxID=303726 RepID=UPI003F6FD1D3
MLPLGASFRGSRGAFASRPWQNVNDEPRHTSSGNAKWRGQGVKDKVPMDVLIKRYRESEVNGLALLHQLAQSLELHLELKETGTSDNIPYLRFAFCAVIDGIQYKTGIGTTKKEARHSAAELALREFLPTLEMCSNHVSPPLEEQTPTSDIRPSRLIPEKRSSGSLKIPLDVRDQLAKLMNGHPEFSACAGTTAAFFTQSLGGCTVVAVGTGDINAKESASSNGRIVHDSHAVVAARRSLMRFLYRHLLMFYSQTSSLTAKSVFQQNSDSGLLSLKSGISLHLYVNQLPKGVAQIPSKLRLKPFSLSAWQANDEISLHLSVEGKVFSILSPALDHPSSKMVSMSATDKLTQWQVLGYQGALLSHFIEPVYVQSILVGDSSCTDVRGMEMSVCQRVEGITPRLPTYYCMMRPHVSLVPSPVPHGTRGGPMTHCVNWSDGDSSVEVVDGLEGKTTEESPFKSGSALASRLCKAAMLHRFKLLAKGAQREDLLATSSYREAKRMAKPYQEAKSVLRAYLLQQGFGSWLVKASQETTSRPHKAVWIVKECFLWELYMQAC